MPEKLEFLLGLSAAKLAKLEKALEINWIFQLALAAGGFALVFEIGDFPRLVARYFGQEQYSLKPIAGATVALLLYFFMRFGHLLVTFLEARKLHDDLLNEYVGNDKSLSALRETTSFFEGYYSAKIFGGRQRWLIIVYYTVTAVVISLAQASALFLFIRAYGLTVSSSVFIVVCGIGVLLLYTAFWRTKKDHPHTTKMVIGCIVLVVIWLVVFNFFEAKP